MNSVIFLRMRAFSVLGFSTGSNTGAVRVLCNAYWDNYVPIVRLRKE